MTLSITGGADEALLRREKDLSSPRNPAPKALAAHESAAAVTTLFTEETFAPLIARARTLAQGIADFIIKHGLHGRVTRMALMRCSTKRSRS